MLITLETTHGPATDLGFLLHKNPDNVHTVTLPFGRATVLFPEASEERCRVALFLEVDPVALVRGRGKRRGGADQYVNDRPYVASSFLSVALNRAFGSAMKGRSKERPELAAAEIDLRVCLPAVPLRGGEPQARALFEPLGYRVEVEAQPLDPAFPDWGTSRVHGLTLETRARLADVLNQLYVLIPVLDDEKHYYVGRDEVDKLLARAGDWLTEHPERERIASGYLRRDRRLTREALERIVPEEEPDPDAAQAERDAEEEAIERPLSLNQQRLGAVVAAVKSAGATSVIDLGCGGGNLLNRLLKERSLRRIVGVDVSVRCLERAAERVYYERMNERERERFALLHGSLTYRDERFEGFDVATVVEVIEHLDLDRLTAFERVLFAFARPQCAIVTTPNAEYNVRWETLPAGQMRHGDHRFEWSRAEFRDWCAGVAERHGYTFEILPIGPEDPEVGAPTQMAVLSR